jgi:hypothetical protein
MSMSELERLNEKDARLKAELEIECHSGSLNEITITETELTDTTIRETLTKEIATREISERKIRKIKISKKEITAEKTLIRKPQESKKEINILPIKEKPISTPLISSENEFSYNAFLAALPYVLIWALLVSPLFVAGLILKYIAFLLFAFEADYVFFAILSVPVWFFVMFFVFGMEFVKRTACVFIVHAFVIGVHVAIKEYYLIGSFGMIVLAIFTFLVIQSTWTLVVFSGSTFSVVSRYGIYCYVHIATCGISLALFNNSKGSFFMATYMVICMIAAFFMSAINYDELNNEKK